MDNKTLSHITGIWKYHIVFATKYHRKAYYDSRHLEIESCKWKGAGTLKADMLLEIPLKFSVSNIIGYLKDKWGNARYRNKEF